MNDTVRRTGRLLWVGVALTLCLLMLTALSVALKFRAGLGRPLPIYGQIADFTLTNQNGQAVSLANLRGHIWVADVIFTRCAGPCLKMSRQMKELQDALPTGTQAKLLTVTTDPDYDTPSVLSTYARRFGADQQRWMFLTGLKPAVMSLAVDSLKLTAVEKPAAERETPQDLFIHSTIFVVVDKRGQLRGVFETSGEGVDPLAVKQQIISAVRRLEREG